MSVSAATVDPADACVDTAAISLAGIHKRFDTADGEPLTVLQDINLQIPGHGVLAAPT